jgi:hypothetical protein
MPSVARELPLDQPLYITAELIEHRRNILRYAARFRRAPNEIIIDKLRCCFGRFSKIGHGWTHILLKAPAASVATVRPQHSIVTAEQIPQASALPPG